MAYTRKDMQYVHYRWADTLKLNTLFYGEPSRRLFDPNNGDQVLFIINYYISQLVNPSLQQAKAVESRIAHQLPPDSKSERSVIQWLFAQVPE